MFIVHIEYKKALADIDKLLPAHRDFLRVNYEAGRFLLSGPCEPRTGGVVIAVMDSASELEEIMKKDPFYVHDAASFSILEFKPNNAAEELKSLVGR